MNIGWSAHLNSHNKKCEVEYFIHKNILRGINYFNNELNFYYCIIKTDSFEFDNISISSKYSILINHSILLFIITIRFYGILHNLILLNIVFDIPILHLPIFYKLLQVHH